MIYRTRLLWRSVTINRRLHRYQQEKTSGDKARHTRHFLSPETIPLSQPLHRTLFPEHTSSTKQTMDTETLAILCLIHPVKENVHPQRLKKARNSPYKAAQSQTP